MSRQQWLRTLVGITGIALLLIPILPVTTAQTATDPQRTIFREALVGDVQRLNPLLAASNSAEEDITRLIYEGLASTNARGEPIPQLAESWLVSKDNREVVVRLRQDVLWHDGISFSADDVLFTLSILADPGFAGNPQVAVFWRNIEVEKLDAHTVRFRLVQPLGSFLSNLTLPILPVHVFGELDVETLGTHPFNLSPIGTGPYQLLAIRSDGPVIRQIELGLSPVYWRGSAFQGPGSVWFRVFPTADEAIAALAADEVDAFGTQSTTERQRLLEIPLVTPITGLAPYTGMLLFNWERPPYDSLQFRQALLRGFEPEELAADHMAGMAIRTDSPIPPLSWAYESPEWPNPDQTVGQALLAGMELVGDAELLVTDRPELVAAATAIASQWTDMGFAARPRPVSAQELEARIQSGEYDLAIYAFPAPIDPDPYLFWHASQTPDGMNYGGVVDDTISTLIERGRHDMVPHHRREYYAQFQQEFIDRAIAIPLYNPLYTYAVSDRFSAVQFGQLGSLADRFRGIANWVTSP
jgi:peptide/nickel transport system substrate-binding protein